MDKSQYIETSSKRADISGLVKDDHRTILELFRRYLCASPDSRETIAQQILGRLVSHMKMEEHVLFRDIRRSGSHDQKLIEDAELEHEEVRNMIRELQQSESDDDQAWDELFEDMMETARVHFATEEHDLLPLVYQPMDG